MKCPFLEEVVVRYCKAFPVKKMIPRDSLDQESPCTTCKYSDCPQFQASAFPEEAPRGPVRTQKAPAPANREEQKPAVPVTKKEGSEMPAAKEKKAPAKERQCIWTKAGVVSYRLCTQNYECDSCQFNQSLLDTTRHYSESPEMFDFANKLRNLPANQRKCRYMLMGEVSYKLCPNNYMCGECSFDQAMQYSVEMHPRILARREKSKRVRVRGFSLRRDFYFHPKHTWAKKMTDGTVRVGLDDFAQALIGSIDGIKLPSEGDTVTVGKRAWEIESGQRIAELVAPIGGIIEEINPEIKEQSKILNDDPYGKGWIMRIRPDEDSTELPGLTLGEEARSWVEEDVEQLYSEIGTELGVTIADGGQPLQRASASFSEKEWLRLVKRFLEA